MRILLLGDASNFHRTLAEGLRALGHTVTVASDGTTWMNTPRDIDLSRRLPGRLGGLDLWLRLQLGLRRRLTGYDIVSTTGYCALPLRPSRVESFYDYICDNNPNVFLTALETDTDFVSDCLSDTPSLGYSEFRIDGRDAPYLIQRPEEVQGWISDPIAGVTHRLYSRLKGAVSALYEYHAPLHRSFAPDDIAYGGIPINTATFTPTVLPDNISKVRLFLGRHSARQLVKGTDIIERAARSVVERYPTRAELVIVENRPYDEYIRLLRSAHIVLDQLYSYTPATNALIAMAYGLCTLSGGAPEYYDFIGEPSLRPIFHVEPTYESVVQVLTDAVLNPAQLHRRSIEGRALVEKHNDYITVARRFLHFWQSKI